MITNRDIMEIFRTCVPIDRRIPVQEIHAIVESNYALTKEDLLPNPSEVRRGSTYPSWKRKVQATLHELKKKHKIQHFEYSQEYIFGPLKGRIS